MIQAGEAAANKGAGQGVFLFPVMVFVPAHGDSHQILTVQGFGRATAAALEAVVVVTVVFRFIQRFGGLKLSLSQEAT